MAYLDGFYYPMLDNTQKTLLKYIFRTYPFRVMILTTGDIAEDLYAVRDNAEKQVQKLESAGFDAVIMIYNR